MRMLFAAVLAFLALLAVIAIVKPTADAQAEHVTTDQVILQVRAANAKKQNPIDTYDQGDGVRCYRYNGTPPVLSCIKVAP